MTLYTEKLTAEEAVGMTVNERLWSAGWMHRFDDAVARNDAEDISNMLKGIHLDQASIDAIIASNLEQ